MTMSSPPLASEEGSSEGDFRASLTFLTRKEGGRKTAAHSGYRPFIKFEDEANIATSTIDFIDTEIALPGERVIASIRIIGTSAFSNTLYAGLSFEVQEGERKIGFGTIIEIYNPTLKSL